MSSKNVLSTGHWAAEVEALCTLLRTELSACEAYRAAIHVTERDQGNPALSLRCLYRSHRKFADELRGMVRELGGHPTETVGEWGVWSAVHEHVATRPAGDGAATTLRFLRHGERYSCELALGALHDLEGPPSTWVKERLVKGVEANLCLIEALERSVEDAAPETQAGQDG